MSHHALGSARQLFLWARQAGIMLPVVQRNVSICKITWRPPAYHTVVHILHNPIYAGAYAFGRRGNRIRVIRGRARKTSGHDCPISEWGALLRDNHEGATKAVGRRDGGDQLTLSVKPSQPLEQRPP